MNRPAPLQRLSFRTKALLISLVLQTMFVVIFAGVVLYLLTERGTNALRGNLAAATSGYARNAAFVFIGSLDANRTEFLSAASGSPNIEAAFLVDAEYRLIATTTDAWRAAIEGAKPPSGAQMQSIVVDRPAFWVFYEPVFAVNERECQTLGVSETPCEPSRELLGYFGVIGSKELISSLSRSVTLIVITRTIVLLGLMYWATARLADRLYSPMLALVDKTMKTADQGYREKIAFAGPKEVEDVATAINYLIGRATQNAEELETLVAEKTREEREARRQAESARTEAERIKEWRTELMAVNTHELLTPVRILIGELDLTAEQLRFLGEGRTKEAITRHLERMRLPITRIEELVEQVNIAMRIAEGRVDFRPSLDSLDPIVERLRFLYAPEASRRQNTLHIGNEIPEAVTVDHRMLETIASNLLSNACKFTQGGDISMRFFKENGDLVVACRDSGVGIPENRRALIFEPLYQGDMSSRRVADGLGLGLSIVKGYVDRLGGSIDLGSAEKGGTTVTIRLPLAAQSAAAASIDAVAPPAD